MKYLLRDHFTWMWWHVNLSFRYIGNSQINRLKDNDKIIVMLAEGKAIIICQETGVASTEETQWFFTFMLSTRLLEWQQFSSSQSWSVSTYLLVASTFQNEIWKTLTCILSVCNTEKYCNKFQCWWGNIFFTDVLNSLLGKCLNFKYLQILKYGSRRRVIPHWTI